MPEVKPFSIATIRAAVAQRVAESSLRAVALEIGMSWSGLRKFLAGGSPHQATAQKLMTWYQESLKAASPKRRVPDRAERADVDAALERIEIYLDAQGNETLSRERARRVRERLFGGKRQDEKK